MTNRDLRRHERIPYTGPLHICAEDGHGSSVFWHAKCVDLSEGGLRVEAHAPVSVGAYLSLRVPQLNLGGSAKVKRIGQRGAKYLMALELSQPMPGKALAGLRNAAPIS